MGSQRSRIRWSGSWSRFAFFVFVVGAGFGFGAGAGPGTAGEEDDGGRAVGVKDGTDGGCILPLGGIGGVFAGGFVSTREYFCRGFVGLSALGGGRGGTTCCRGISSSSPSSSSSSRRSAMEEGVRPSTSSSRLFASSRARSMS